MKLLILTLVLISGCTTAPTKLYPIGQKNGRDIYEVICAQRIGECYQQASSVCGGKFDVEQSDNTFVGFYFNVPVYRYTLMVLCEPSLESQMLQANKDAQSKP